MFDECFPSLLELKPGRVVVSQDRQVGRACLSCPWFQPWSARSRNQSAPDTAIGRGRQRAARFFPVQRCAASRHRFLLSGICADLIDSGSRPLAAAPARFPCSSWLLRQQKRSFSFFKFTMTMLSSENRAVAPVFFSSPPMPFPIPTPSPGPDTAGQLAGGQDGIGKPRTLQGPSAKEWASHRDTIVGLYRQYPLKRVSEIMRKQYGFSARYGRHMSAHPLLRQCQIRQSTHSTQC